MEKHKKMFGIYRRKNMPSQNMPNNVQKYPEPVYDAYSYNYWYTYPSNNQQQVYNAQEKKSKQDKVKKSKKLDQKRPKPNVAVASHYATVRETQRFSPPAHLVSVYDVAYNGLDVCW